MKKLFFILFVFCGFQLGAIEDANESNDVSIEVQDYYGAWGEITGPTTLTSSGGNASAAYTLRPLNSHPSGTQYVWSIIGSGRGYVYPNGKYCNISVYGKGSYRLLCDIYVNGERVDGVTTYITVY